jgi:hypothetical protein
MYLYIVYQDSEPTALLYHPKQKPRRGGGPESEKHLPPNPYTAKYLRKDDL